MYEYVDSQALAATDPSGLDDDDPVDNPGEIGGVISVYNNIADFVNRPIEPQSVLGCGGISEVCVSAEFKCPASGTIKIVAEGLESDTPFGGHAADDDFDHEIQDSATCTPNKDVIIEYCSTAHCKPQGLTGNNEYSSDPAGWHEHWARLTIRESTHPYALIISQNSGQASVHCDCCQDTWDRLYGSDAEE